MTSIKKALRKKKVKAWAILDRKNIMWVGCDGYKHQVRKRVCRRYYQPHKHQVV